jgi:hypothetical protein
MHNTYQTTGLRFAYPGDWDAQEEQTEEGLSITVSGDGSAFCSVMLMPDRPSAESVIEAAMTAYRESYDDFDVYPVACRIAGQESVGRNVDFFCMELVNSAWLRAFRTGRFTVLVLAQSGPDEQLAAKRAFDTVCDSLNCDSAELVEDESRL